MKASPAQGGYLHATRHPLVCVLFVLPLLLLYEVGIRLMGPGDPGPHRNGADLWLRDLLAEVGIPPWYGAPGLILGIFLAWGLLRRQRLPRDLISVGLGMTGECVLFAVGLFGLSQVMLPLFHFLQRTGLAPDAAWGLARPGLGSVWLSISDEADPIVQQIVRFLGAGLYEETLFRLLLFSGLLGLFIAIRFPRQGSFILACVLSALVFAAAHHLGQHSEPFHYLVFLFRTLAGCYFAMVYEFRGFGIAVGTHALYDVLVGVVLPLM